MALTYTTGMTNASLGAIVACTGLREHTMVLVPILAVSVCRPSPPAGSDASWPGAGAARRHRPTRHSRCSEYLPGPALADWGQRAAGCGLADRRHSASGQPADTSDLTSAAVSTRL